MEFIIDKSKRDILDFFKAGINNSKDCTGFDSTILDSREIRILDERIFISRKPKFTSPFRPNGQIVITISEISDSKTKLIGKVVAYDGYGHILIIFTTVLFLIFTFFSLILGHDSNIRLVIFIALIMCLIGMLFEYLNTRSGLMTYLNEIINMLKMGMKASH